MRSIQKIILTALLQLLAMTLFAQERIDEEMVSRIKEEGFQRSRVMETLSYLTDVHGPRLLASPGYFEAATWAKAQMESWGLQNVRLESIPDSLRGWSVESYSVELVEPRYTRLPAYPRAWTAGTEGEIRAAPMLIEHPRNLDSLKTFNGQLQGRILLMGRNRDSGPRFEPFTTRFTYDELAEAEQHIVPAPENPIGGATSSRKLSEMLQFWRSRQTVQAKIDQFLIDEGVAAVITPSRSDHGILHVDGTYVTRIGDMKPVANFVISNEQYGRIIRMIDKGIAPVLKLHLRTTFYDDPSYRVNILAEIAGTDKKLRDQLVMVGAHFDSWHSGTGATDNGAGSAVMMEVMRILKKVGAQPRRTIRIALWTGEEQGLFGSRAYAKKYLGEPSVKERKPEANKISAYFNLDNGSGKIRGVYLQGNEAVRPIFAALLSPFDYLDATTLTVQNTTGTDHLVFDELGIPAFQFIQDPLNYGTVTHHTNMDVYENLIEDDLRQNAVVVASLVYHIAMRDAMLHREVTEN